MDQVTKKIRLEALVPFDETIWAKKNLALAESGLKRSEELERFKPLARAHGKRIKELDADIARLSAEVTANAAKGMVDAEVIWDWDDFTKTTIRCDTGEKVSVEAMSAEERREPPLVDVGDPAPGAPPPKQVQVPRRKKKDEKTAPPAKTH